MNKKYLERDWKGLRKTKETGKKKKEEKKKRDDFCDLSIKRRQQKSRYDDPSFFSEVISHLRNLQL